MSLLPQICESDYLDYLLDSSAEIFLESIAYVEVHGKDVSGPEAHAVVTALLKRLE